MSVFPRTNVPTLFSKTYGKLRKFDEDLVKMLDQVMSNLSRMFDHGISVADNLDQKTVSYTSNGVADTEDTIAHTLGRVPIGFWVITQDKAASFYAGGTAFTTTAIYLKSSVASVTATVIVF